MQQKQQTLQEERAKQKRILLGILNPQPSNDPVLADPITKEAIILIPRTGTLFGSGRGRRTARRISYAGLYYILFFHLFLVEMNIK